MFSLFFNPEEEVDRNASGTSGLKAAIWVHTNENNRWYSQLRAYEMDLRVQAHKDNLPLWNAFLDEREEKVACTTPGLMSCGGAGSSITSSTL